jgi:hypothetical protein
MNNPSTGATPSPRFERHELWPFYRQAIAALRDAGERRPLWIDAGAASETADAAALPGSGRISSDGGLIYAPHEYTGVFSSPSWPTGGTARLSTWYDTASRDARRQRMAVVVGEWGAPPGNDFDTWIADQLDLQDQRVVGSAFWMWKQRAGFYNWPVVQLDGRLRGDTMRAQILSRPHPDAVPGRIVALRYASGAGLSVLVDGPGGDAVLWSGMQVLSGGPPIPDLPLTHASVDGRPVSAALRARQFSGGGVSVGGYLVTVRVPRGRHTVVLG